MLGLHLKHCFYAADLPPPPAADLSICIPCLPHAGYSSRVNSRMAAQAASETVQAKPGSQPSRRRTAATLPELQARAAFRACDRCVARLLRV
jgi:hypothetical protein